MKAAFFILIMIHGLIHLTGFVKAYNFLTLSRLTQFIPKAIGIFWLLTSLLFILTAILFLLDNDFWWIPALAASTFSQYLLITNWNDGKFGTIANLIILIAAIFGFGAWYSKQGEEDTSKDMMTMVDTPIPLLTVVSIQHFPLSLWKCICHPCVIGKPKMKNIKVKFLG